MDYKRLDNLFPDEDENEDAMIVIQMMINDESYNAITNDGPISLKEAKKSPDWPKWEKAIEAELEQLWDMGTWKLVNKLLDAIPIANKWLFVKKTNNSGQIEKYKARLVIKGCSQRPGFDYNETYSPVVRMETIRSILAMALKMDLRIQQMDVKGTYLNGILKEDVYMRQPDGYNDGTDRVCKLVKTLYGLKQSGREWNIQFNDGLQDLGFTRLYSDPCAYVRRRGNDFQIITVWVDDLLLFANTEVGMRLCKEQIAHKWQVTDLGEPSKIIGIQIKRGADSISISQTKYIEAILKRENMDRANPVATPLDPNVPIQPNPDHTEGNRSNPFAQLLGELQYLANATRPDIAFTINRLASFTANPSMKHYEMIKRILRYLAGTKEFGITYRKSYTNIEPIIGYSYAAHGNCEERKSTTGVVFVSGGGAVLWRSKKQTLSAQSSTEAEYIALAHAGCEACWFHNLYTELGFPYKMRSPSIATTGEQSL
jgi:hypothetical protein